MLYGAALNPRVVVSVKVAMPLELIVPEPIDWPFSWKVTTPVGVAPEPVTVAEKVTVLPKVTVAELDAFTVKVGMLLVVMPVVPKLETIACVKAAVLDSSLVSPL